MIHSRSSTNWKPVFCGSKPVSRKSETTKVTVVAISASHLPLLIADDAPQTVADGLKVPLKDLTWHFVSKHVTDILTASEEEIVEAMKLIWKRMKIVMEPSSAVPLATILKNRDMFAGKRVGVIVTGGNVDLDKLPWQ